MKTSNEWIRDIHKKADKRFAEQKRRRKMIISISSSVACLALILCSVIAIPNLIDNDGLTVVVPESSSTNQTLDNSHNNNSSTESNHSDNPIITPHSSEVNPINPNIDNPSTPLVENPDDDNDIKLLFAENKIISQISAAPKYRDPKEHHKEFWTQAQITEYLGVDLTALPLPTDLTYTQKDDFRILFHNNGEIVEDYQSFIYKGENNRKVEVLVSKISTPFDCIYKLETENKTPVGGTKVLFGAQSSGKNSFKYDFYYADFTSGGLYYRVKADNLTQIEFYKIVEEITVVK